MTVARARMVRPSRRLMPVMREPTLAPLCSAKVGHPAEFRKAGPSTSLPSVAPLRMTSVESRMTSTTSACLMKRLGCDSSTSRIFMRYCCLSHCARGDQTAGPREVLSRRNWMPTASATSPMMPPRASTSRTRWPLAMPPMAGLQDICAMRSRFSVKRAVRRPMRAEAIAASQPACPAPTTTTSYCSVKAMGASSIVASLPAPQTRNPTSGGCGVRARGSSYLELERTPSWSWRML